MLPILRNITVAACLCVAGFVQAQECAIGQSSAPREETSATPLRVNKLAIALNVVLIGGITVLDRFLPAGRMVIV
jgi:hypothetical protein